jgi:hypothetical protein
MATKDEVNQQLGDRLKNFLNDVVTLDVLTLSGNITLDNTVATPAAGKGEALNWDNLFQKITSGMTADPANKLEVIAYTHAQWDCDSVNYVKAGASASEQALIENHGKTVEAAHRSRFEALKFVGNAIASLF